MLRNKLSYIRTAVRLKTTQYRNPKSFKMRTQKIKVKGEILYGHHPVLGALMSNKRSCHRLFISENYDNLDLMKFVHERDLDVATVDTNVLNYICGGRPHQGVCMDANKLTPQPLTSIPDDNLLVYLHGINDPMNMGAIIRCCAYFGLSNILLSEQNSCRLSPVVSKASSGAMEAMEIYSVSNPLTLLRTLMEQNWTAVATGVSEGFQNLSDYIPKRKTIVVLGNEGSGLPDDIMKLCSDLICIQSLGNVPRLDSLNVSVATGIVLHHFANKLKSD